MNCKEIAGISIAGNHEGTKKLRITYNEVFSNKNSKLNQ